MSQYDLCKILNSTKLATVEYHDVIDSTNNRAKELVTRYTVPLPALIVACRQTAGRGRGANKWWTAHGSFAGTFIYELVSVGASENTVPLVAIAAGLAVRDTVVNFLGDCNVQLYWPNDVYVAGRKLAGILVEVIAARFAAVGIGINVNNSAAEAPDDICTRVATMRDVAQHPFDLTAIAVALAEALNNRLKQLRNAIQHIVSEANRYCGQIGQTLAVSTPHGVLTGECRGIASDGSLRLQVGPVVRLVRSGQVIHPQVPQI